MLSLLYTIVLYAFQITLFIIGVISIVFGIKLNNNVLIAIGVMSCAFSIILVITIFKSRKSLQEDLNNPVQMDNPV